MSIFNTAEWHGQKNQFHTFIKCFVAVWTLDKTWVKNTVFLPYCWNYILYKTGELWPFKLLPTSQLRSTLTWELHWCTDFLSRFTFITLLLGTQQDHSPKGCACFGSLLNIRLERHIYKSYTERQTSGSTNFLVSWEIIPILWKRDYSQHIVQT